MPGLLLSDWGPAGWNLLHAVAHTQTRQLTEAQVHRLRHFLYEMAHFLPCKVCSGHFSDFLDRNATDAVLSTRAGIVRLLHDAHNDVNIRTGKRALTLSEHYRLYDRHKTEPTITRRLLLLFAIACTATLVFQRSHEKKNVSHI